MIIQRYFVLADADWQLLMNSDPSSYAGVWCSIDLASLGTAGAGYHCVLCGAGNIPATWQALPSLLDPTTTISAALAAILANTGVTSSMTMFQAATALGAICGSFAPT